MDAQALVEGLANPQCYPDPVKRVQICQTHISVVALTGAHAYKLKKPVSFGFLDFSTLDLRRHFCEEEVRLNRRLAPDVYLGVVPVTWENGFLKIGGNGNVVEWAVKMVRLPEESTLQSMLRNNCLDLSHVRAVGARIAQFHAQAERGKHVSELASFEVVARNARENFEQTKDLIGDTLHAKVYERLQALTESSLVCWRELITRRAERFVACETHGDLRLDHVYVFPDREPPGNIVIIDCIEFNERFRFADPMADVAFLAMDLHFHGRRDLAETFVDSYVEASGDEEGRCLLPFYLAYRAAVRGKVEGFELGEKEIPDDEKVEARARARAHWLLALQELEQRDRKPCLVLTAGLPGTGKSTLARELAETANFHVLRSDAVRKELVGAGVQEKLSAEHYSSSWSFRTYEECLRRAELLLFQGERVICDANFRKEEQRIPFVRASQRWGVPLVILHCHANPDTIRNRLSARNNDASDADWEIYQQLASQWEPFSSSTLPFTCSLNADRSPEEVQASALLALSEAGLISVRQPSGPSINLPGAG